MPVIARHASTGDIPKLKEAYVSSTVLSFVLSVPATFGLIFLSQPIIRVIFEHGNFTASDTLLTANALTLYAIGLFAYSALKIIVPVFYALDKTKYPVIGSFITIFLNISIVLTTIKTLHYKAIPLSVSLCVITNFFILSFMLYREVKGYEVRHLIQCLIKIIPVSLIMGAGAYWINGWCENMLAGKPFENLIPLLVAIVFGVVFYGAAISIMDIKEVTPIKNKIISKLSGKRI
jgi:putative peptidoglycan lipid II flippase